MAVTVLFSGGVDSVVHARWAQRTYATTIRALYLDCGQGYASREGARAAFIAKRMGLHYEYRRVVQLPEDRGTGRIPLRNLFFLELASLDADIVVFGMLKGEEPPDKTRWFTRQLERILRSQRRTPFDIATPFANYSKSQMIRWYQRLYGDEHLSDSVGCFSPSLPMCGRCMSCFNRWLAWQECNLPPEHYAVHPGQDMLERLRAMHHDRTNANWHSVSLWRAWVRRQWLWETRRQLNIYCRKHHDMSAWRYTHL